MVRSPCLLDHLYRSQILSQNRSPTLNTSYCGAGSLCYFIMRQAQTQAQAWRRFPSVTLGWALANILPWPILAYPGLPGHTLAYPGLPWPTSYLGLRWPTPAYPYHCPHWRTLPWPTLAYPIPWPTPTLAYTDIPWLTPYHGLHLCPGLPWPTLAYTIPWHALAWPPHPGMRWPTPTLILAYPGLPHTLVHPDPAWPTLTYPDPGLPWPSLAYLG